jgi:hypothetical protein
MRRRFKFLEFSEIPSLELRLAPLQRADFKELLSKLTNDPLIVELFLGALARAALDPTTLLPWLAMRLFSSFMKNGDLSAALNGAAGFAAAPTNVLIFEQEGRLRALPALQGEATGLDASEEDMKRIVADAPSFVRIETYDDIHRKMKNMVELKKS